MLYTWFRRFAHLSFIDLDLTCFHKSDISSPQQPSTERMLKFNMIFHDSMICVKNGPDHRDSLGFIQVYNLIIPNYVNFIP